MDGQGEEHVVRSQWAKPNPFSDGTGAVISEKEWNGCGSHLLKNRHIPEVAA